ncbi:MAG: hypothetical protein V1872_13470 [bacterium]
MINSNKKIRLAIILTIATFLTLYLTNLFIPFGRSPFSGFTKEELKTRIDGDYENLKESIFKMDSLLRKLRENKDIFSCHDLKDLNLDDREKINNTKNLMISILIL